MDIRSDLVAAQADAWAALATPGTWWSGFQRAELAATACSALTDADVLPPWATPSSIEGRLPDDRTAATVAHDVVYRIAVHAGTLTREWYEAARTELGDVPYVELVGITCTVAAVVAFRRAAGLPAWQLPTPVVGEPSRTTPADLVPADLNWVRVTAPADERAAVVQAFSSVPDEDERLWMLAAAQYIPNIEMVDPQWTRGTLTRPQIELVAARVSQLQECFY
jgi:hypothetical protein